MRSIIRSGIRSILRGLARVPDRAAAAGRRLWPALGAAGRQVRRSASAFRSLWPPRAPARPPAGPGPAADKPETTVLVARGTGGRLELCGNRLRLVKGGAFGFFVEALGIEGGFVERTIRVSDISAVELDKPALFFRYVRFCYPGSPPLTGNDVEDMMAENALIMSLIDNRNLYRIKEAIERSMDRQVDVR
jgi:hypothetical protein